MFQQFLQYKNQLQQLMKTQDPIQALRNMVGNNPRLNGLLNQLESLTPEQQKSKLNEIMNNMGISEDQMKKFLGYK